MSISSMSNQKNRFIFVVGSPRSGTTMLGLILGRHPLVHIFDELHFFDKAYSHSHRTQILTYKEARKLLSIFLDYEKDPTLMRRGRMDNKLYAGPLIEKMDPARLYAIEIYKEFLKVNTLENNKLIPLEHTPAYIYHIDEILYQIPDSKIVYIIRDPRDVLLSRKNRWKLRFQKYASIHSQEAIRSWVHYHPLSTSRLWYAAAKTARAYENHPNVHTVRYEDILDSPETKISEICRFVEIDYYQQMLNVSMMGSSSSEDRPFEIGIDKTRYNTWQKGGLNSAEIFFSQKINNEHMKKFHYQTIDIEPNPLLLLFYFCNLPIKMLLSLFIHIREFKNIFDAACRRIR